MTTKQIRKALADLAGAAAPDHLDNFIDPQAFVRVLTLDQLDTLIKWLGEVRDAQDEEAA